MLYTLITDGAFSSSRNQGGYAFILLKEGNPILEFSQGVPNTTNNRMELMGIIIGLRAIKKPIDSLLIVSDSMYCIGTATLNWKRKANQDLWKVFDKEYQRVSKICSDIQFQHVKGHQKNDEEFTKWNNRADNLAVEASQRLLG